MFAISWFRICWEECDEVRLLSWKSSMFLHKDTEETTSATSTDFNVWAMCAD